MKRLENESFREFQKRRDLMNFTSKVLRSGTPKYPQGTIAGPTTQEYKRIMLRGGDNAKLLKKVYGKEKV